MVKKKHIERLSKYKYFFVLINPNANKRIANGLIPENATYNEETIGSTDGNDPDNAVNQSSIDSQFKYAGTITVCAPESAVGFIINIENTDMIIDQPQKDF